MTEVEDTLDLLDDGRIRIAWDGKPRTLRRPRLKEYKEYKQALVRVSEEINSLVERVQITDDMPVKQQVQLLTEATSSLNVEDVIAPVMAQIITDLSNDEADADDLPVWLVTASDSLQAMMKHWRAVPLDRGKTPAAVE